MRHIAEPAHPTLPPDAALTDALARQAAEHPDRALFASPVPGGEGAGAWRDVTAAEAWSRVQGYARGLVAAGVGPGDRVAIMAATRLEWTLVDYAIWAAGAVTVPVYETSSPSQVAWIFEDAGVCAAVVDTPERAKTVRDAVHREGLPPLRGLWTMDPADAEPGAGLAELSSEEGGDEVLAERRAGVALDSLATVIYTSGTTGRPKGCELTHANFAELAHQTLSSSLGQVVNPGSSTVLFIPLAHVFARFVSVLTVEAGARCGHVTDLARLSESMESFRPTFLLAVPRVFEKIYNAALLKAQAGGKGAIFERGADVAVRWSKALEDGRMTLPLRAQRAFYSALIYRRIRAAMGGALQYAVSGGGPLSPDLAHFFRGVGVTILEGYGLTETTAPVTVGRPGKLRIGTVGRPLGGNEIRIEDDGEILTRGTSLFRGYRNRPEADEEAFTEDGWFRTGDLGSLDEDGFLRITGRKKEIIVTAGGKNVAPAQLEDAIRSDALISQVMVVGDAKPFIAAIVTLDADTLPAWLAARGLDRDLDVAAAAREPKVREHVQSVVDRANAAVSKAEGIREFRILDRDFSAEEGHMTPSLKMRRAAILKDFAAVVEDIYAGSGPS
ncbi:long-chain fatty acid--CoA ligase [Micrococcus flavus]|uniref:Acyl-CoA synthetase n=2 Tax=Micrococcus flavus TaxID=384602 RepID=A0A4Y8WZT2_9MICC|nr:long-chain fatty acid--CoA ligase [Micrococcus flavus]MBB4882461.1 long-chain acyl-CoA synthetase [Micrococcus flavus]TFI01438.1 long-chain fatty acid--CoA ligase [Micrococcus flavus]